MDKEQSQKLFEKVHCGNNPHNIRKNTTTNEYVLPCVQDAYAGWQSAVEHLEPLIPNKKEEL